MAELVNYKVVREHTGDKITDDGTVVHHFAVGETRLADPTVVANLVPGVLEAPKGQKAEPPHENKAEKVEENKAPSKEKGK